jgi:glutamate formiminotransferase/formiminotetrahydrofolate cyclodeaminase
LIRERIVEWKVQSMDPPKPLIDATVKKFVYEVRARKAAPGGGSVAALVGSLVWKWNWI